MFVVALAMVAAGALLVVLLRAALVAGVDDAASAQAAQVAGQMHDDGLAGLNDFLPDSVERGQSVQVVDAVGRVVGRSAPSLRSTPLSSLRPARGETVLQTLPTVAGQREAGPFRLLATGIEAKGQPYTVLVLSPLGAADETTAALVRYLLIGGPLFVLLVGLATWVLLGRTLRPVTRLRAGVQAITPGTLDSRVPVPRSADEVAQLALSTNRMLDRLHAGQLAQRRFVADASHELRSPLATLLAGLEVAGADPTGDAWRELARPLLEEGRRMQRLVADLLVLATVDERGTTPTTAVDVDLDDIVAAEGTRLRIAQPGLQVSASWTPARVRGDRAALRRMVGALVENAGRHARHAVRLTLEIEADEAVLTVDDDGPGIALADRERVFERFVRLEESRSRAEGGSGLGLAIAAEVARRHGGTVSVATAELGGARFEVRLPVQTEPPERPTQP